MKKILTGRNYGSPKIYIQVFLKSMGACIIAHTWGKTQRKPAENGRRSLGVMKRFRDHMC
jgi:hypothetical protein